MPQSDTVPAQDTDADLLDFVAGDAITSTLADMATAALHWLQTELFSADVAIQLGLIAGALVPAAVFGQRLKPLLMERLARHTPGMERVRHALAVIATPITLYLTLSALLIALRSAGQPTAIIGAVLSLLTAWIVIRLVTLLIRSNFWSRVAFYVAWPLAALDAFGMLDDVARQLDAFALPLGQSVNGEPSQVSLLDIARSLLWFVLLFFAANGLARFIEARLENIEDLTPALKTLIVKILNVLLPVLALLTALQIVGFNLATLTVFGGAVGLGIGLGLQGLVANFIAGFTLISDKSIRPRDVIEIDNKFGWVTGMHARYVAMRTRDGTEHLIPNERFMQEGVINWSRSDKVVRQHAPFGVSYGTRDLRAVQAMAVEAASQVARVVAEPKPVCNLMGFGDSSVDFDLRFWITDPQNGLSNVRSEVYMGVWERLHANGIEIPFPQRDLHVRSWSPEAAPPSPGTAATGAD